MKALIVLLLSAVSAMAQVVTLVAPYNGTNSSVELVIEPYQTAELLAIFPLAGATMRVEKDGGTTSDEFTSHTGVVLFHPVVVTGPAVIHLFRGFSGSSYMATFRLTPEPYPVGSALLVPPGPGGASVVLQCSTNLVDWSSATNGAYTGDRKSVV